MVMQGVSIDVKYDGVQQFWLLWGTPDSILGKLTIPAVRSFSKSQICIYSSQMENISELKETVDPSAVPTNVWCPKS